MSLSTAAQRMTAPAFSPNPGRAPDPFGPAFYAPYAACAQAALALVCAARGRMREPQAVLAITYRLKTPASIRGKLAHLSLSPTDAMAAAALHDIAGLRIVLSTEAQVYAFAAIVRDMPGVHLLGERDYIAMPKRSGYRSLHLILRPRGCAVAAELQLRTPQMDTWAAARHDIIYKPQPAQGFAPTSPR